MDDLPKIGFGNGSFLANEDSDSGIQKDRIMFLGAKEELSASYKPTVMKDKHEEDEPIRKRFTFYHNSLKFYLSNLEKLLWIISANKSRAKRTSTDPDEWKLQQLPCH